MTSAPPPHNPQPRDSPLLWGTVAAVLLGAFLVPAMILWTSHWTRGRAACDQYEYHLKAILTFAHDLPRPDLHDYLSATTPGYHLALAVAARALTTEPIALQIVGAIFTIWLLVLLARVLGRAASEDAGRPRRTWIELAALALPVVCSPYVFTSGVWLLPDNAGWLLAMIVTLTCLRRVQSSGTLMFAGLALAMLMFVRQSHLWAAAPILMAGWLHPTASGDASIRGTLTRPTQRVSFTLVALLCCIPGIVVLAGFASMWHGLTPPTFQHQHVVQSSGLINWATIPFILALVGVFSPFYLPWVWPGLARLWRESRPLLVLIALAATLWAAIPETTFLREPRSGGLWSVVGAMDARGLTIAHHTSPLILLLAPIGAAMLAAWIALIDDKRRWIIAAAVGAFIASQSANANCWQRYHEPFLLLLFALVAARYGVPVPSGSRLWAAWRVLGPLLLAVLLAAVSVAGALYGRDPLHPDPKQMGVFAPLDPSR